VKRPDLSDADAAWAAFWWHSEIHGHTFAELVEFQTAVEEVFGQTGQIRPPGYGTFVGPTVELDLEPSRPPPRLAPVCPFSGGEGRPRRRQTDDR
jgi:hypothetical protein